MRFGVCAACAGVVAAFFALVAFGSAQAANPVVLPAQQPIRVHVRIEGPDRTLFNGVVSTTAKAFSTVPVPGTACDEFTVRAFSPQAPSPLTALNDALTVASTGFWSDPAAFTWGDQKVGSRGLQPGVKPFSYGPELCRVGRYVTGAAGGWQLKVNNTNGGGVSPTGAIGNGASVLWYWADPITSRTFDLKLPTRAMAGKQFSGHVDAWENSTNQRVDAVRVKIAASGKSVLSGPGGDFKMKLNSPGKYVIGTAAPGAARGSDVICIYKRGSGECGTRKRRR